MVILKIGKGRFAQRVDVLDAKCAERPCLQVGSDHGPYTPGVGYTAGSSYRSRLVCLRRHLHGCPSNSVCPACRTLSVDPPGAACTWCGYKGITSTTIQRETGP